MENQEKTARKRVPIKLPDFIIIPYPLLEDEEITLIDERLYGIIYWFTKLKNEKCTASNPTLADLVKTTSTTIQNSLTKLETKGYIVRKFKDAARRHRSEIIPLVVFHKVSPTDDTRNLVSPTDDRVSPTSDTKRLLVSPTDDQKKNIYNKNRKEEGNASLKEAENGDGNAVKNLDRLRRDLKDTLSL